MAVSGFARSESFAHLGEISPSAAPHIGGTSAITVLPPRAVLKVAAGFQEGRRRVWVSTVAVMPPMGAALLALTAVPRTTALVARHFQLGNLEEKELACIPHVPCISDAEDVSWCE